MRSSLRARVVVNDLRGELDSSGPSQTPAQEVVDEIRKAGSEAIVSDDNVCDFAAAGRMIESAIDAFGGVDVLVCNEGILRDRMLVNMSESEWDAVIPPPPLIPILMGSRPPL